MNIILFGPPGAGKGTQSTLLKNRLGMVHISTGDLFRNALKNKTTLGVEAQKYIDAGQLVPDDVTIGMVNEVLASIGQKSFILDGFPRNIVQADALEEILAGLALKIDRAVFISISPDVLVERLSERRVCEKCGTSYHVTNLPPKVDGVCDKCGGTVIQRTDDRKEVIEDRIRVYEKNTQPLKDYYEKRGKLQSVDGRGSTEEVFESIKTALG